MARATGASVVLINGQLTAFLRRRNPALRVLLPENEPERTRIARELAKKLAELATRWQGRRSGLLIGEINDAPAREHFLARFLEEAGFVSSAPGFHMRRVEPPRNA
jgi:ATP-dependent Lhr-like helicase